MDELFIGDILALIENSNMGYMAPENIWIVCPEVQDGWSLAELDPAQDGVGDIIDYSSLFADEYVRGLFAKNNKFYITIDEATYRAIQDRYLGPNV